MSHDNSQTSQDASTQTKTGKSLDRWLPSLVSVVVAVFALVGTWYASDRSVEASESTVEAVSEEWQEKARADLFAIRRSAYIEYIATAENFYGSDLGDESELRRLSAAAIIVASPSVRSAIDGFNDIIRGEATEQEYLDARNIFLDAVARELSDSRVPD